MKKIIKTFNPKLHPEYDYVDIKLYLDKLKEEKYIKKNTFSILYHQMFNLIKTYVSQNKSYKYINLTYGHIILLSYLMGYIKDVSASESFWGSNNTLASDIGVSSRTIQRWLKDLEDTGFIKIVIERNTDRYIYVNFGNIISQINRAVGIEINSTKVEKACKLVVEAFIRENHLERDKQDYYIKYLIEQCEIQYCISNDINIKYLFEILAEKLDLEWKDIEGFYKPVNHFYIERIANAK